MIGDLPQRLTALGSALEVPPAPDVVPAVLPRLADRRRRRRRSRRRVFAIAIAAVLLLAGVAMAVPSTRHTILRVLGLRGVRIARVQQLPPVPEGARLGLGTHIPLATARHAASFSALLPPGSPIAFLSHDVPGGRISFLLGHVLIIEFRGRSTPWIGKLIGPQTRARRLRVDGGPGAYLSGAPHEVVSEETTGNVQSARVRLAGNVLLWEHGPLTLRIEGTRSLAQALAIADSLR
jgi:hypothetical protein